MSLSAVPEPGPATSYTAARAAQLLGVSERRVRQLVEEGRLPADRDPEGCLRLPEGPVHAERTRRPAHDPPLRPRPALTSRRRR